MGKTSFGPVCPYLKPPGRSGAGTCLFPRFSYQPYAFLSVSAIGTKYMIIIISIPRIEWHSLPQAEDIIPRVLRKCSKNLRFRISRKELWIFRKIKSPESLEITGFPVGDLAGIRTPDPLLKRQLLCLLSYQVIDGSKWQGRRDSNPLYQSQSLVCYLYTTSLWMPPSVMKDNSRPLSRRGRTGRISTTLS